MKLHITFMDNTEKAYEPLNGYYHTSKTFLTFDDNDGNSIALPLASIKEIKK